ncbi:MAG: nucleotide sugar dehydrogenase [Candidatus Promineifilaceae bacterium]|nr:nucleotide sugar dehydrogenase [Candidatus Promineifilaceae bacterium]
MSKKIDLINKFLSHQAHIGIVGLGYVGLPLAVAFAEKGFTVTGIDVNPSKVNDLNEARSYVEDVCSERLVPLVHSGCLRASTNYAQLSDVDAISICVPTPLRKTKDPDISYIIGAANEIAKHNGSNKLIVLESTTYPGSTDEIILPRLISHGAQVGVNFFLAFSPERIDPGRTDSNIFNTPKVIGGVTPNCLEVALALYSQIVQQPVPVSSTRTAEMVKLLENTFRAVNIGLVNEVALMCDKLGLNVWEVIDAAKTKPYGFMTFYPGPGLGGHCIPVDPHYLSWKLRTLNYTARFIELAAEVNRYMPEFVVGKIMNALNQQSKAVNGSQILILGVAYKPNIGDVRESPALDVIHLLLQKGACVSFNDPFVKEIEIDGSRIQGSELTIDVLENADCVVVITDHQIYDWDFVSEHAKLIVDSRNAVVTEGKSKVIKL